MDSDLSDETESADETEFGEYFDEVDNFLESDFGEIDNLLGSEYEEYFEEPDFVEDPEDEQDYYY